MNTEQPVIRRKRSEGLRIPATVHYVPRPQLGILCVGTNAYVSYMLKFNASYSAIVKCFLDKIGEEEQLLKSDLQVALVFADLTAVDDLAVGSRIVLYLEKYPDAYFIGVVSQDYLKRIECVGGGGNRLMKLFSELSRPDDIADELQVKLQAIESHYKITSSLANDKEK